MAVALGLLFVYQAGSDFYPIHDAKTSVLLAESVLADGDLTLTPREIPDTLYWWLTADDGQRVAVAIEYVDATVAKLHEAGTLVVDNDRCVGGFCVPTIRRDEFANTFSPGAALTAAVPLALARPWTGSLAEWPERLWLAGKLVASLAVAISAGLIYLVARRLGASRGGALVVALAYGLGTGVWSTGSQALWQHGPNEMYLALGLWCLVAVSRDWRWAVGCGLALGAATWCRPTGAIVVLTVGAWLLLRDRRALVAFVLAGMPLAMALAAYNYYYFGSPLQFGQLQMQHVALEKTGSTVMWQTPLLEGLRGLLLSPSRGLFVYSPFLAFCGWGMVRAWREPSLAALRPISLAIAAIWSLEALHYDWWGGWAYGYRHIVDTATLLVPFLAPVIDAVLRRRLLLGLFLPLLAWSIVVQAVGATAYNLRGWNGRHGYQLVADDGRPHEYTFDPAVADAWAAAAGQRAEPISMDVDLPEFRHRLWSWRDSQIVYYLTHFGEARRQKRQYAEIAARGTDVLRAETHTALAEAWIALRDEQRAELAYRTALEVRADFLPAQLALGQLLLRVQGPQAAAAHLRAAQTAHHMPRYELANQWAIACLADGRFADAAAACDDALDIDLRPAVEDFASAMMAARDDSPHWSSAAQAALERDGARLESLARHYREGRSAAAAGALDEAVGHFESAVELADNVGRSYRHLGLARLGQGQVEQAVRALERAVALDPDDGRAHRALAAALAAVGRHAEAAAALEKAAGLVPHDVSLSRRLAAARRRAESANP